MNRWTYGAIGVFLGLMIPIVCTMAYLFLGRPPVAVADKPFPKEKQIVGKLLRARIASEMQVAPEGANPSALEIGAAVYQQQCAFCHGLPGHDSLIAKNMYPAAPQLWRSHRAGVTGVSDDPVGETFWKVKNGIRLTGMPSYQALLSEEKIWDVSLLLASAAKPLPGGVEASLKSRDFMVPKEKP